jgi:hypothetical protein
MGHKFGTFDLMKIGYTSVTQMVYNNKTWKLVGDIADASHLGLGKA